jgi:hypothetical protein
MIQWHKQPGDTVISEKKAEKLNICIHSDPVAPTVMREHMPMQHVPPPLLEQDVDTVAIMPLPLDATELPPPPEPNLDITNAVENLYLAAALPPVPKPDLAITDATVSNMFNGADEMLDAGETLLMFASANGQLE